MFLFYVNPILIAAAVIPAIVLLRFVYKEDRLDKESPGLLLSLVIFGILSTFAAIVTEQIGETVLTLLLPQNSTAYNALLYFVVVALSEEGFKYLLLKKRTWYSGEFNCQFDGIVYAAAAALPCSCRCCCTARTTSSRPMSTMATPGSSLRLSCCSSPRHTA